MDGQDCVSQTCSIFLLSTWKYYISQPPCSYWDHVSIGANEIWEEVMSSTSCLVHSIPPCSPSHCLFTGL
jgi:hypothetical protein